MIINQHKVWLFSANPCNVCESKRNFDRIPQTICQTTVKYRQKNMHIETVSHCPLIVINLIVPSTCLHFFFSIICHIFLFFSQNVTYREGTHLIVYLSRLLKYKNGSRHHDTTVVLRHHWPEYGRISRLA